jgi:GNAT superfamily N-acetyltransferase
VLQLTYLPPSPIAAGGARSSRGCGIDASLRATGLGRKLFAWAIERARERGCHLLQLTSDKARPDAIRFYESLGFVASHEGLKLRLT